MAPILLLLSRSSHSLYSSLSLPLLFFFFFLFAPCCFVLYSNFHWLKLERAEVDETWAWRKQWREVGDDGGMLMEGAFERAGKANRYQGFPLRRKMIWITVHFSFSSSLTPTLSFSPCFSSFPTGQGHSAWNSVRLNLGMKIKENTKIKTYMKQAWKS